MKRLVGFFLLGCAALVPRSGWSAAVPVQWPGFTNLTYTDVDPHGVAGPQGILEISNQEIAYYTRAGVKLWGTTNEQAFFLPTVCCDAKGLYDTASQRFFIIAQDSDKVNLHVAVSRSSNPASGSTNDWRLYKFPTGAQIDYPGIGLDGQALYASYGNAFQKWLILNKAQLLSGATNATTMRVLSLPQPNYLDSTGAQRLDLNQGLQATTVVGSQSPGDVAYCVTFSTTNTIRLSAITNVLGVAGTNVTSTNIPCPSLGRIELVMHAPQPGTPNRLNAAISAPAMGNAFWRDGELWFCGVAASTNQPERTLVRWYKLKTGGFPNGQASLAEWGDLDGGTNTWRQHPSIGGNARGDVCLVFTEASSNNFNRIYSAIRKAGESSFSTLLVKTSTASWTPSTRWADYSVVTPDPEDQTFWVSHLTIKTTTTVDIWWANITRDSVFYVDKNAVGAEVGSRELPYHTVRAAHTAASGAKTFVIKPASYPEPVLPLRLDKNVRLENPYPSGTVHIGP